MSSYNELNHHGIQGQKWGKRRYQNPDGTLTAEGKARYSRNQKVGADRLNNRIAKAHDTSYHDKLASGLNNSSRRKAANHYVMAKQMEDSSRSILNDPDRLAAFGNKTVKQRIAIAAGMGVATALTGGLATLGVAAITESVVGGLMIGGATTGSMAAAGKRLYDETKY